MNPYIRKTIDPLAQDPAHHPNPLARLASSPTAVLALIDAQAGIDVASPS